jgi:hypothetical protein
VQVVRVAADGDRKLSALRRPAWEALRQPELWVFSMSVMGQERLIAMARSLSGCFALSDLHHLLKILRYCVRMEGLFASLASSGCVMVFTRENWQALHFSKAALRNDASTKMDDGLAALFFSWDNYMRIVTAMTDAKGDLDTLTSALVRSCNRKGAHGPAPWGHEGAPSPDGPSSADSVNPDACATWQRVFAAYWFFVLGACIHLVISGELTPEERIRVAEYGLATALITFWIRAHAPADQRDTETRRGRMAWAPRRKLCRSTSSRRLSSLSSSHRSRTPFAVVFLGQCRRSICSP